ncbi:CD209 antigen-like protein E [Scylla paramamosain]|uniref:CD209 antigen-like protein E n=1 Tax=Scylla paramamosain TaxID=85552 RepID=UPI003082E414
MQWAAPLAVAVAALCFASVQAACPNGFTSIDDVSEGTSTCIRLVQSKSTWQGAKAMCEMFGASLAKLTGDFHQAAIEEIRKFPELTDEAFWIGGSDEKSEGSWYWLDDDPIPLGTPHWYPCNNQPNHGTDQNHLCLYTPDFFYHSLEQQRQIYSICQTDTI